PHPHLARTDPHCTHRRVPHCQIALASPPDHSWTRCRRRVPDLDRGALGEVQCRNKRRLVHDCEHYLEKLGPRRIRPTAQLRIHIDRRNDTLHAIGHHRCPVSTTPLRGPQSLRALGRNREHGPHLPADPRRKAHASKGPEEPCPLLDAPHNWNMGDRVRIRELPEPRKRRTIPPPNPPTSPHCLAPLVANAPRHT